MKLVMSESVGIGCVHKQVLRQLHAWFKSVVTFGRMAQRPLRLFRRPEGSPSHLVEKLTAWLLALVSLALPASAQPDGTVVGWGDNWYGQASPPAGLSNVVAIATGFLHSLALLADGTVVGWGYNDYRQATPPPSLSNVVAIAAGWSHSLGLLADGTVVGWGDNWYGQASPPAGLSNVVAIATGFLHSLALLADGTVVGWGYNDYRQATPPAGLREVVAIAAGRSHSLALKQCEPVVVLRHPTPQAVQIQRDLCLSAWAAGVPPLSYEWRRNGVLIPGATTRV